MSIPIDQPDWTGLNAVRGDARLVASGMASAVNFSVDVDLVPTDRSLVIAVGGGNGGVSFTVVGMTSFTNYHLSVASRTTTGVITFPAYGAIDPVVRVGFSWTGAFEQWFILAVPDEALPVPAPGVVSVALGSTPALNVAQSVLTTGSLSATLVGGSGLIVIQSAWLSFLSGATGSAYLEANGAAFLTAVSNAGGFSANLAPSYPNGLELQKPITLNMDNITNAACRGGVIF